MRGPIPDALFGAATIRPAPEDLTALRPVRRIRDPETIRRPHRRLVLARRERQPLRRTGLQVDHPDVVGVAGVLHGDETAVGRDDRVDVEARWDRERLHRRADRHPGHREPIADPRRADEHERPRVRHRVMRRADGPDVGHIVDDHRRGCPTASSIADRRRRPSPADRARTPAGRAAQTWARSLEVEALARAVRRFSTSMSGGSQRMVAAPLVNSTCSPSGSSAGHRCACSPGRSGASG